MAKKKSTEPAIRAEATAKTEISAKIIRQRKHSVTEVIPPDVTRAKAGAWLDLISPITEWAGLKGDALKFKRHLLRIQQEDSLLRVAQEVRKKLAGQTATRQVPRKILIPALEKASLEDADDDVMVDRWANLLASAATDVKVQPRFVGILEEMSGRQAECLERVAFNRHEKFHFPATILADSCIEFAEHHIRDDFEYEVQKTLTQESKIDDICDKLVSAFNRPGVYLRVVFIFGGHGEMWEGYDVIARTGIHDESDFSILESLGLVREVVLRYTTAAKSRKRQTFEISVHYYHLTGLGVEFCEVCSRTRMAELEKIGTQSSRKGLKRQEPFG
jgi:Abortive infection alpha